MGGEQPPDSAATVVDAQENVSPTGDRTNESDVDDTLTSAQEKVAYAQLHISHPGACRPWCPS